jgi:hypothetical protein
MRCILPVNIDINSMRADKATTEAFTCDPNNPFLVSFPRTGSHWLRMLMELYFERPTLVRAFYYPEKTDFLLMHRHDEDLQLERCNVIYLYREPVPTVYSQLQYYIEDTTDTERIIYWADLYGRHLDKWLHQERFTTHKTVLTYEGMQTDIAAEFAKVTAHFQQPMDKAKLEAVTQKVTKEEVKRKTPHDEQVLQLGQGYQESREVFIEKYSDLVWQMLLNDRPQLREDFSLE